MGYVSGPPRIAKRGEGRAAGIVRRSGSLWRGNDGGAKLSVTAWCDPLPVKAVRMTLDRRENSPLMSRICKIFEVIFTTA